MTHEISQHHAATLWVNRSNLFNEVRDGVYLTMTKQLKLQVLSLEGILYQVRVVKA
jgi:hypothetical protein